MGYMAGENGSGLLLIHSYPRSTDTEDSFSAEFEALGVVPVPVSTTLCVS